jgi:hypothetical protein
MDELMKELKAITNAEGNKINDEWAKLQLELLRQSIPLANEMMASTNVKAVLCVGQQITHEQFDADDHIEQVGPNMEAYSGIGGGEAVACRMKGAMGTKTADHMLEFLENKELLLSLHNASNYMSLLMCVKMKKSFFSAMTTPGGVAISISHADSAVDQEFYLPFSDDMEDEKLYRKAFDALTVKQRKMITGLAEAQQMPPKLKQEMPEIYEKMMYVIKQIGHDHFADPDAEQE